MGVIKDPGHAAARDALALAFKVVAHVIKGNKLFAANYNKATQELLTLLLKALRGAGWEVAFPELGSSETVRASLVRAVDALLSAKIQKRQAEKRAGGH